jgi:hypothetical protein
MTKKYYADRVILALQDAFPNIDFRIDEREIFLVLDGIVNAMAKDNYFENWKAYGAALDEQFVTEWSGDTAITCVDVENQPSYLVLPISYLALPKHGGIVEIWPENYDFGAVKIMDHADVRRTRNLMSGNLQGELGGYPKKGGTLFEFTQVAVGGTYATTFGVRLAGVDSSLISASAPYPIPGNLHDEVIKRAAMEFKERRLLPTDTIRDKNDGVNRY